MRSNRHVGLFLSALLGLALSALSTQAQTNFWWTNNTDGLWGSTAVWSNELGGAVAPAAGGSNDYIVVFQNAPQFGIVSATNNSGTPNFLLNQLQFTAGSVTLLGPAGSSLAFSLNSAGVLPSLVNNSAQGVTLNSTLVLATNTAFSGFGPLAVNSNISGVGKAIFAGTSTVTLNASNSYAGGTVISNGTVKVGVVGTTSNHWAFGAKGTTITVADGGTLDFNNVDLRSNYVAVISGAGVGGAGALVNNVGGWTTAGLTNITLAGDATFGGSQRWDVRSFSGLGLLNLNGNTLTKVGAGTISLVGDLITDGNIVINAGQLAIEGTSVATGGVGTITLNTGGTMYYYSLGPNQVTKTNIANGGTLQFGSGGGGGNSYLEGAVVLQSNLTVAGVGGAGYIRGVISESGGSFAINKTGNTNLILAAANTFSGGITNSAGWLILSNANALGTGQLVMNGGTLSNATDSVTITNTISLQAAGTINTRGSTTTTYSGPITNTGALTINAGPTGTGGGIVQLLGNNTFSGNFTIGAGRVVITNAAALGTGAKTLSMTLGTAGSPTLVLDGSGGAITLPSTMALSTSYAAGSGAISNAAGNNVINGAITLTSGGGSTLLMIGGGTLTLNGNITPNQTSRALIIDGAAGTTGLVNGVISSGGLATTTAFLTKQGAGVWILANDNIQNSVIGTSVVVSAGTLQIGNGGTTGSLGTQTNAVNISGATATLAFNRADTLTVSNLIFGAGRLVQNGSGLLVLAGTNSYTGKTLVNNGTILFATTNAVPTTMGGISNNLGGAVGGAYSVADWQASGRLATNSLGALALVGNSTEAVDFTGPYTNLSLGAAAGTAPVYAGTYTPVDNSYGVQNYNLGGGGGTLTFVSAIPSGSVRVGAPGAVLLAGNNAFSGGLTITAGEGGALFDAGFGAAGNLVSVSGGTLQASGLAVNNLGLHTLNADSFNGGVNVVSPFGAFVITTNLTGSGSLAKTGAGTLLLQGGANTYSGGTSVSNGTLRLLPGGGNNQLATNGALAVVAGNLDLAGSSQLTTNAVSFQGGVVQNGALTAPANLLDARAGLVGVDLTLTGSEPLVKTGSGLLTLLGNNTYSGGTVLSNGLLAVVSDANLGGAASAITFAGGGLTILGSALNNLDSHTVNWDSLPAGTVLDIAHTGNVFTVASLGGTSGLIKTGAGTLLLTNNNAYSGGTLVSGGLLQVGNGGALGTGNVTNNAALVFSRPDAYAVANNISGSGAMVVRNGTLTLGGSSFTNASLVIADTPGINATLNLTNTAARTTSTTAGALTVGAASFAQGTLNISGGTLNSAGELWIAGGSNYSRGVVNLSGGVVVVSNLTTIGRGAITGTTPGYMGHYGELNISGGSWSNVVNNNFTIASYGGNTGRVTVTGGDLYIQNALYVGEGNGATTFAPAVGQMVIGGGLVTVGNGLYVGQSAAGYGALIQTGGVLNVAAGEFDMGNNNVLNYGFYQLAGGVVTNNNWMQAARGGLGLIYMTGGTNISLNSGAGLLAAMSGGGSSTGVIYIAGSTVRLAGSLAPGYAGNNSRGEVTLADGANVTASTAVRFNNGGSNPYGILNLNSGSVLTTPRIYKNAATTNTYAIINMDGGTLVAQGGQPIFMGPGAGGVGALDAAYIYGNGVTFDSSNFNITIAQNLLGAQTQGNGVTSLPALTPVSGYVGAPYVAITGGGGTGATAIAQFDFTTGTVTGLVLTSAGVGYTSTPTVSLMGGGIASNYLGAATLGANTSGALTKQGLGSLQLTGTNTYAGGTVINNGLLVFASTNATGSGLVTLNASGALGVTGAYGSVSSWLTSGRLVTNSAGALALGRPNAGENIDFTSLAGGVYSNLGVGAIVGQTVFYTGTLGFINNDYRLGGGGGTLAITNDLSGTTLTVGLPGTGATNSVALNGTLAFSGGITVNSNAMLSLASPTASAITLNNAALQVRGTTVTELTLNPAIGGGVLFDINHPGNVFSIATNLTAGGGLAKLGTGTLALGGSNNFAGNVTIGAGALRMTHGDALSGAGSNVLVVSGAALQLQGGIASEVGDQLTLNGTGTAADGALRNLADNNTWRGPVVLGSAARINADAGTLTLVSNLNNATFALTVGGAGNTLISGAITNTGSLVKDGSGTLTLAGSNTYTGATTLNGGNLALNFSTAGAPANNIVNPASTLTFGGSPTLTVIGGATGVNTQSFNALTLGNVYANIAVSNNGFATLLNLPTISSNSGGAVNVTLPALGGITANNVTVNGILSHVTVNGQDWATLTPVNYLTPYTGYTLASAAGDVIVSNNANNVKIDATSAATVSVTSRSIIYSLLANDPGTAHTVALGGQHLSVGGGTSTPGSMMLAAGSAGLTLGSTVNDGSLSANSWLFFINNSANDLTIHAAISNGANYVAFMGAGPTILNGANGGSGNFLFNGPGSVMVNGTNSISGNFLIRGGAMTLAASSSNALGATTVGGVNNVAALTINGPTTLGGNTLTVGAAANDRSVLTLNTNAVMNKLLIGTVSGAGATIQNGGAVSVGAGLGTTDYLSIGQGGYGYYQLNGGTLLSGQFAPGGSAANSVGVYEQFGGTATVNGQWYIFGWGTGGRGVVNLYNGTMAYATNWANPTLGYTASGNSYGAINLLGDSALLDLRGTYNVMAVEMMRSAGNLASVINLNSGTLLVNQIKATSAGLSLLNFNGGTLLANTNTSLSNSFVTGLAAATIYAGGATIDTTNNASIIIPQNLAGPSGFGVTNIALANAGAGYIGAPVVLITGGSGTGATAIAQFDAALSQVTNILVTSYGSGYLPTDALTLQLVGGGYTTPAQPGALSFAANQNTGGLTKKGSGMLTLTGTNTYGGTTVINEGTLVFQPVLTATNSIGGLSGSGTLQHNGLGMTILNGSGAGYTGAAAINTGTVWFTSAASVPVNTNVTINARGTAVMDFGGGAVQTALGNGLTTPSSGVIALTPNSAGETINFNTLGLASTFLGAVGTVNYDLVNHTPVGGAWKLGGGGGTLNLITTPIAGADSVTIGNGVNAGTVVFNAANTHSGATVVNPGMTLRLGAANTLSASSALVLSNSTLVDLMGNSQTIASLAGGTGRILNTNSMATLTVGDASSTTFGGSITGAVGLTKVGAGMLTLTNSSTYTGPTIISAGTLQLANVGNQAGLTESWSAGQGRWVPYGLTNITTALYPRYAETNTPSGSAFVAPIWPASFPANGTVGYSGYVYNNSGSNVTWTFAANIDDNSRLVIDGIPYLSSAGNATVTTNVTLTPGVHSIDFRLDNGTGGAGSYGIFGMGTGAGTIGFGYDPLGRNSSIAANYIIPQDSGNGLFFTTGLGVLPTLSPMYIASGATLDLNSSTQNVAFLSDYAGGGGSVTNYAGSPAALRIVTYAGSNTTFSGNLGDAGSASALSVLIMGSGVQTLSGTNTYSGGTLVNGGYLQYADPLALATNVTINASGTVQFSYANIQNSLTNINTTSSGTLGLNALTAAENLNFNVLNLSNLYLGAVGDVTYTGAFTNYGSVTRLGGNSGTLTFNQQITNGLVYINPVGGAGTVKLGGVNSYTGTVLNAGTLQIGTDTNLGTWVANTTNLTFNGGTLQAGGPGVALNTNRILLVNAGGGTLDDNGNVFTINGAINGSGAMTKLGSGTLVVNGSTNTIANLNVRSGMLSNGVPVVFTGNINLGAVSGDRAVMSVATDMSVGQILFGSAASNAGAVYQTGGRLWQTAASGANNFQLGAGIGSYGYFKITGGTNIAQETHVGGNNGGYGVFENYGGFVSNTSYFLISRSAQAASPGAGVVNLFGGTLSLQGMANRINFMDQGVANQFGTLSIMGNALLNAGTKDLQLNQANQGTGTILVNFNGGTAIVGRVLGSNTATQVVGFNGGVLKAGQSSTTFFQGVTAAPVYAGGAKVDDGGFAITINQNLLAPTGYGVTNITLTSGGTGYIGAPVVRLTGGSGIGASAIAQVDADGVITNLLITSAGTGYQAGDVLVATLLGGGATANATVGTVQLGANSSSGGLVKLGAGTLSLGGTNTYGGATVVSAGNLQLGSGGVGGTLANPSVVFSNNASWLGFNRNDWVTNGLNVTVAPGGNLAAVVQNGTGVLVLTNTAPVYDATWVSNGVVYFSSLSSIPNGTPNSIRLAKGASVAVGGAYGTAAGWLASGLITNNSANGVLALMNGVNSENINFGVYTNLGLGVMPGQTATILGTLTPAAGTTNYFIGGGGGALVIGTDNVFTDAGTLTNRALTIGNNGLASTVQILGPQSYTGGTTITNAFVSISADANLGYGGVTVAGSTLQITNAATFSSIKPLTLNAASGIVTLDIGTGSTATWFGAISSPNNANGVQKLGGGTFVVSNTTMTLNTPFWLKQGTMIVDSGAILTNAQYMSFGQTTGDNGTLIVRGTGQILATGDFNVGDVNNSVGLLTVQDSANLLLNQAGGNTFIGKGGTSVGTLNMNGGTMSVGNLYVANGGTGVLNLNGGVLIARGFVTRNGGTATLNLNGGTLRAGAATVNISNLFNTATISGTSYLDTSNNTVNLFQAFTGSGTLVKQGSGNLLVYSPSNTFAGLNLAAGTAQFAGTNGMTPGRTVYIGAGAAAGYTNNGALNQDFLLRIAQNSVGTVMLTISNNNNGLDFRGAGLTNVSLGAYSGVAMTNSGAFTNFGTTWRLGGGGGTLVLTNNNLMGPGTNLVAFGNSGTGTLILTGTNQWTSTTVSGGLVRYGSAMAMGTNVTVTTGGAVANNGALDTNLFARINTASDGAFALVANNAVANGINLSAYPSLSLGAAGGIWTNDAPILPNGTTYRLGGGGGTLVITNNSLNGAGTNLVAFGGSNTGNLVLAGTNTFDGGTLIGSLGSVYAHALALGTGAVTNNGTLVFSQAASGAGSNGVLQNVLSGTGALVISNLNDSGKLFITNNNPYAGAVYINRGYLALSNQTGQALASTNINLGTGTAAAFLRLHASQQLNPAAVLSVTGGASSSKFELNGFTQTVAAINSVGALAIIQNLETGVGGTGLLIVSNDVLNSTWSGHLRDRNTGSGTLALTKDGAAALTLSGANVNYTGLTTLNNGLLVLSNTTAFTSAVNIVGGQLLLATPGVTAAPRTPITNNVQNGLGFSGGNAFTIGSLAGSGGVTLWSQTGGGVNLTLGSNNLSSVYSGVLSDAGPGNYYQGAITKVGSGTITLSGANTYNGRTTVGGTGYLVVGNGLALGTTNGDTVVNSGAMLQLTNGITVSGETVLLAGGGTDFYGALQAANNSTGTWAGTVVLNDASANNPRIGAQSTGVLTVSGPIVNGLGTNLSISGGAASGTGVVIISGTNNTYTGITGIIRGVLKLGATDALPTTTILDVHSAATTDPARFDLAGFNQTIGRLQASDSTGGRLITNSAAGASVLTVNQAATTTYSGLLAGNLGVTKSGAGQLTLSGANSYGGDTVISGGTLKIGANNTLPVATTVYADAAGTLDIAGLNQTVASIHGSSGTINDSLGGGRLTVNFASSQSFLGKLTGPGNLTLTGGGTMNLTGTNSFSGATLVSNATLAVNGLHNGGVITAISNGLVRGTGPISTLYVDRGGTYGPGNSLGTQLVASLTLTNAGVLEMELGASANDQTIVTNSLVIADGAQLKLNLAAYSFVSGTKYTLVEYTGTFDFNPADQLQWFMINDVGGASNSVRWAQNTWVPIHGGTGTNNFLLINYDDLANGVPGTRAITLTSAIPEPGTASLLGLIGVLWLVRRICRRRIQG